MNYWLELLLIFGSLSIFVVINYYPLQLMKYSSSKCTFHVRQSLPCKHQQKVNERTMNYTTTPFCKRSQRGKQMAWKRLNLQCSGAAGNMYASWVFACDRKKILGVVTVEIETYGSLGPRGHIRTTTDITWCITVTSSGDEMTLACTKN